MNKNEKWNERDLGERENAKSKKGKMKEGERKMWKKIWKRKNEDFSSLFYDPDFLSGEDGVCKQNRFESE